MMLDSSAVVYPGTNSSLQNNRIQNRLFSLAAGFVLLYSTALTISPAVRAHSWDVTMRWNHWAAVAVWFIVFITIQIQARRTFRSYNSFFIPLAAILSGWGILTIYRLFPVYGLRQATWLIVGGALLTLGLRLSPDLAFLRRYKYLWLTGGLLLTALTFLFGTNPISSGPRLWLGCCGLYLQPSEPLKLLLIIYLSAYLADRVESGIPQPASSGKAPLFPVLSPTLSLAGIAIGLLLAQRDLGTATIFLFLFTTLLYLSTGHLRIPLASLGLLLVMGLMGYLLFDLVRLRLEAWINPWLDPSGRSFQIIQSLMAIANGGLPGRGPGLGSPSLVPVAHSDFIYTAIVEESGLLGAVALLTFYGFLVHHGLKTAIRAQNNFLRFLAAGLTAYLVGQSILIIGGNTRLLPLTGVTLPFVSYGGSSLVTSMLAILLLLLISENPDDHVYPLTKPHLFLQLGGFLFAGLASLALITGWWSIYRAPALLGRTDNPRRSINDRFVLRGSLFDRNNIPISLTLGEPGSYQRSYASPHLGPVVGYTHAVYGQSGLEASLDEYLRGMRGNPASEIWLNHFVYGQPPPGLDVRLALDTDIQSMADNLLAGNSGAMIVMDAKSGDILAMASHPAFDANRLDEEWPVLLQDPQAPLVNRATSGVYQPGTSLGAFLLAGLLERQLPLPPAPNTTFYRLDSFSLFCSANPGPDANVATMIANGCPTPLISLENILEGRQEGAIQELLVSLGFYNSPQLRMLVAPASPLVVGEDADLLATGQASLRITPLQMALAAAALSGEGIAPAPRVATGVNIPQTGWVVLAALGEPKPIFSLEVAAETTRLLAVPGQPYWQALGNARSGDQRIQWYLAGTLPDWQGSPLVVVLALEIDQAELALEIGTQILHSLVELP